MEEIHWKDNLNVEQSKRRKGRNSVANVFAELNWTKKQQAVLKFFIKETMTRGMKRIIVY